MNNKRKNNLTKNQPDKSPASTSETQSSRSLVDTASEVLALSLLRIRQDMEETPLDDEKTSEWIKFYGEKESIVGALVKITACLTKLDEALRERDGACKVSSGTEEDVGYNQALKEEDERIIAKYLKNAG
jgi:hypothetical protein